MIELDRIVEACRQSAAGRTRACAHLAAVEPIVWPAKRDDGRDGVRLLMAMARHHDAVMHQHSRAIGELTNAQNVALDALPKALQLVADANTRWATSQRHARRWRAVAAVLWLGLVVVTAALVRW